MVIRSLIYWFVICSISACVPIIFCFVFFTKNTKYADRISTEWVRLILFLLKVMCGIDHRVVGRENVPEGACIIASKHQSMWETVAMAITFKMPAPIYKKELLMVPFFGWFLSRTSAIKVDRKGGAKSIRSIVSQAKECIKEGRKIIIFPQGTRVPPEADSSKYKYQAGITALYLNCNVPVVPTVLNSGLYWDKKNLLKKKGTITLKFLEPIQPGLNKKEFISKLEEVIEKETKILLESGA